MAADKEIHIDLGLTRTNDLHSERTERARLSLVTSKHYNGGLKSSARVDWVGDGYVSHAFGLGSGLGDFSVNCGYDRTKRATQKAIDTQHELYFGSPEAVDRLKNLALAFYETKVNSNLYKNLQKVGQ